MWRQVALSAAAVAAASGLVVAQNAQTQSTFVSPARDLFFGITVPNDGSGDIYFTLSAPTSVSWAAVGLGSSVMQGALVLMAYTSASGDNVTFSPRLSTGHTEPSFDAGLNVELLAGTGISNGMFAVSGRCMNCMSWANKGSINVTSTSQNCIFATGPSGALNSDDQNAAIQYHASYGAFTVDMVHATGPAGTPVVSAATSANSGTTLESDEEGKRDVVVIIHAVAMVGAFFALMPLGVVILRLGESVWWHSINQGVSLVAVVLGSALGMFDSTYYNRSRSFGHGHQILGLIIFVAVIGQFCLGYVHHRIYKRTKRPTGLNPWHIWLGRSTILLGIVNGFLGFPLALTSNYNYALLGLLILVAIIGLGLFFWGRMRKQRRNPLVPSSSLQTGYDPEPLRNPELPTINPYDPPSPYDPATEGVSMGHLSAGGLARDDGSDLSLDRAAVENERIL